MHFLIAHKVRGVAALDVAQQLEVGDEIWWIVSTSGHRAYPYWWFEIDELSLTMMGLGPMPDGLPDHYAVNDTTPSRREPAISKARIDVIDLKDLME